MRCASALAPVLHPKITLTNTWRDVVNWHKGCDGDSGLSTLPFTIDEHVLQSQVRFPTCFMEGHH